MQNELYDRCVDKANYLIMKGYKTGMNMFDLADLLYKMELEKQEKDLLSDKNIDFNDEIVSIESVGDRETIDISVTGDNLFYCNDILTKNSFGLPMTVDFMIAAISTEELEDMNQIMIKQLKNRYNDPAYYRRFVVGIDKSRMKLYDVEQAAVSTSIDTTTEYGKTLPTKTFDSSVFEEWK